MIRSGGYSLVERYEMINRSKAWYRITCRGVATIDWENNGCLEITISP